MTRILQKNDKIGQLTLLAKAGGRKKSTSLRHRWRCQCSCGNVIIVPQNYLLREIPKTHCGCKQKTNKTLFNDIYRIWCMMHQRCYTPTHVAYKHYGGRGITICAEWNRDISGDTGFENFLASIGPRPSKGHSIDRINVDKGYSPTNCRWATAKEQAANKRPKVKEAS